jgi:regulator of RNase E activity RraA
MVRARALLRPRAAARLRSVAKEREGVMAERPFTRADLETLGQWDTPTICNGLELIVPERRAIGFTVEPMVCVDAKLPPIVGLARTGTIRAKEPPRGHVANRLDWYDYVAKSDLPTVVVLQDVDDRPGYGAYWGEVQSTVHKALGALGCVTNGSFRDLTAWARGFQMIGGRVGPSHAHVHLVDFGKPVTVFGMQAAHDDVIHADYHGAVVIPADAVKKLPATIDLIARREKVILDICRSKDFSPALLRDAIKRAGEIH